LNKRSVHPQDLHLKMLNSVLQFMRGAGVSKSLIRAAFEKSLRLLGETKTGAASRSDGLRTGNENLSAELLRMWHRDGRYIDDDANPKPLSLTKGRNNLSGAILRIDPEADAEKVLGEMKAVKLIRRTACGKYLPTSEAAIVSRLHPLATDHIAKLVIRLVSTVSRNLDPAGSLPLIERHAYAPDLSRAERKAFAEFTRAQGMAYLESVDNWLQQRRVNPPSERARRRSKGVSASVHVFAYLGDDDAKSTLIPQTKLSSRNSKDDSAVTSPPGRSYQAREARA
jgi:hypothetical protein